MFRAGLVCAILVIAGVLSLGGCPGRTSQSVSTIMTAAPTGNPSGMSLPVGAGGLRHADRHGADWSMATYSDPEYRLSFRYPREYAMEDGEVDEHSFFLRRQEGLEPNTKLLATVLIPEDGYPNTTFEHGSLQVLVHENLDQDDCRDLVDPDGGALNARRVRLVNAEGAAFWWSEEKSSGEGTQTVEGEYTTFRSARCYEFYTVVTVGEPSEEEGAEKQADAGKILRQLEKILLSVRISTPAPPDSLSRTTNKSRL